ncbi:pseudouridine-5'-phosphate glycosidase [Nakamurella antarctica]|uniref:Pseudouridine-5'-phosphate glycosidase n=1 Tax=Nakamurella antarctica TaxID=1902245 RepID=A0A3G8ZXH8_9ACTN|nr:pseudouridine-5'-phosphate glycosidase [Nakamurella antarctica]AZI58726.1 pseudouridine-5'-phosphate glycosidase [Nakamurella antarctica]
MTQGSVVSISAEVRDALAAGQPVVALESTIFTHGLPKPRNLEVAMEAEASLRAAGVVPATIGVVDGVPVIGLSTAEIERLAAAEDNVKISIRDLPIAMARTLSGGTTVAATALLAHRAGIAVFSTGGLGGVHRGASTTFDESADLVALSVTPILVISAGVKSILDIPATLERLETLNIGVIGYRTTTFPGFYVRDSGYEIGYRVDTPAEAADVIRARNALGLESAILLANPIDEDKQLDPKVHGEVLAKALAAAAEQGITGNASTPFLLDYVQLATGGRSLDVNIDVYRGNVALGGQVATELAKQ